MMKPIIVALFLGAVSFVHAQNGGKTLEKSIVLSPKAERNEVRVSPNPCHNELHIEAEGFIKAELYRLNGQVYGTYHSKYIILNDKLPMGMYELLIYTETGYKVERIFHK